MYRFEERSGRGKVMVARRDLLPGEIVYREDKPIIFVKEGDLGINPTFTDIFAEIYRQFQFKTTAEERETFMKLPAGMKETTISGARRCGLELKLAGEALELFIKIMRIVKMNGVDFEGGGQGFFALATRARHSCIPNCFIDLTVPGRYVVRAVSRISESTELTINWDPHLRDKSTAERRFTILDAEEFTCHCARCDSLGDDTRKFNCTNPICEGHFFVCHPLSSETHYWPNARYTGVTYVEPYLLPCSVCKAKPSPAHQIQMFKLEGKLERIWHAITTCGYSAEIDRNDFITPHHAMRDHILAVKIVHWELAVIRESKATPARGGKPLDPATERMTLEKAHYLMKSDAARFPFPSMQSESMMTLVAQTLGGLRLTAEAVPFARRALRMHLILRGRDHRPLALDMLLQEGLRALAADRGEPQVVACRDKCLFCEEVATNAAMKLNRCGKCREVVYCSKGCQEAHWKVHKLVCGKG